MKNKKIISILLLLVLTLSFTFGCTSSTVDRTIDVEYKKGSSSISLKPGGSGSTNHYEQTNEAVYFVRDVEKDKVYQRYSFAQLGEKTMPIGVYTPGTSPAGTDVAYAIMKENGINFLIKSGDPELCEKYGFVYMKSIAGQDYDSKEELYQKNISDFNNKYFVGLMQDEPGIERIYQLAYYKQMMNELTDNQMTLLACPLLFSTGGTAAFGWNYTKWTGFVSTFENFKINGYDRLNAIDMRWFDNYYGYELDRQATSGENQLTGKVYSDFYTDVFQPDFFTKTYYPTNAPYPNISNYHRIEETAAYMKEEKVPLFQYVRLTGDGASQASGQTQDRVLSEEEVKFQVNASFAYGAKAIVYYSYGPNGTDETGNWGAALTPDGVLSEIYYVAQEVNRHIAVIDDVLMTSLYKGVIWAGYTPFAYKDSINLNSYGAIKKVYGAHSAIGCYDYDVDENQTFSANSYYLLNTDISDNELLKIEFDKTVNCYYIQNSIRVDYENVSSIVLNLGRGEGGLLVIE